jgi:hypothetical protein
MGPTTLELEMLVGWPPRFKKKKKTQKNQKDQKEEEKNPNFFWLDCQIFGGIIFFFFLT